jgi:hypothetical protein
MLTAEDIKKLSEPFDRKTIGVKVQSTTKDKKSAMLVCYVQHTDVYSRIEEVDPAWTCEVVHEDRVTTKGNNYEETLVYTRMRLTIKGVSRENTGEGYDSKSSTSDALKRAAMLFGIGRYLYDSETVWVPYSEFDDKYRQWTIDDYNKGLKSYQAPLPLGVAPTPIGAAKPETKPEPKPAVKNRIQIGTDIMKAASQIGLNDEGMANWIKDRYRKTKYTMTTEEMEDFLVVLLEETGRKGVAQ